MNQGFPPRIRCGLPLITLVALRAGYSFRLPVHHKLAEVIPPWCIGLPTHIGKHWPNQINPIVLLAGHDLVGIYKSCIAHGLLGQQCLEIKGRMNLLSLSHIRLMGLTSSGTRCFAL